jgi:hypothetical protein
MLKALLLAVAVTTQAPAQFQWVDVTNHPGWQAYGRLNANGYVVDITEWRQAGAKAVPAVRNFGVSLPSPSAGDPVRSNDPEFAQAIENDLAGALAGAFGRATQEAGDAVARPCPGPGPCPNPRPNRLPEPESKPAKLDPNVIAVACVVMGVLVLAFFGFLANPRPKGTNAPQ